MAHTADNADLASACSTNQHDENAEYELPLPVGMIFGENFRPAFSETDSKCLDFFFQVVPSLSPSKLYDLCSAAWYEDCQTALALIFQLGNVRAGGAGKQDKQNFYRAMMWLYEHHPETFLLNLEHVHKHSSLKCLLDLLMFVLHHDNDGRCNLEASLADKRKHEEHRAHIRRTDVKAERRRAKAHRQSQLRQEFATSMNVGSIAELRVVKPCGECDGCRSPRASQAVGEQASSEPQASPASSPREATCSRPCSPAGSMKWFSQTEWASPETAAQWRAFIEQRDQAYAVAAKEEARARWRREETAAKLEREEEEREEESPAQRAHAAVARIFAEGLADELAAARGGQHIGGLFAKWAPTPKRMHDKASGIVDAIVALLFAEEAAHAQPRTRQQLRIRYQTEVLSPLRRLAKVPEHFVGRGEWSQVDFARMASRCRLLYGAKLFGKHDRQRYVDFLQSMTRKTLQATAVLPHEVSCRAYQRTVGRKAGGDLAQLEALEDQLLWQSLVRSCRHAREEGDLGWMVPVCDVSGSMAGEPMDVAVALSLLLAQAQTDSPWHGKLFTFSATPRLVEVPMLRGAAGEGEADLGQMVRFVRGMDWGMNTDIDALFDSLLQTAVETQLSAEQVSKMAIVIFSDMEFDQARRSNVPWETAHEAICAKFADAGFGLAPPTLVYWNLRPSRSSPLHRSDSPGVVLMAGFSAAMLQALLSGKEEATEEEDEDEDAPQQPQRPKVTPHQRMMLTLSSPPYQLLQVARHDRLTWSSLPSPPPSSPRPAPASRSQRSQRRAAARAALAVRVEAEGQRGGEGGAALVDIGESTAGREASRKCSSCKNAPRRGLVAASRQRRRSAGGGSRESPGARPQRKSKVFGRPATSRPIGRYDPLL